MQTNQTLFKKNIWVLSLVIAIFSLLNISSCNAKDESVKGQCITLSRSKIIKSWVNDGYMEDIDYLKFITYYNSINHEFQVYVQAYKKVSKVEYQPIGPLVKLNTGGSCPSDLPPMMVSDNNDMMIYNPCLFFWFPVYKF